MTVQEMFDRLILPKLRGAPQPIALPIVDATNLTVEYIASKLSDKKSDLVKGVLTFPIMAGNQSSSIPANFRGLNSLPKADRTELKTLRTEDRYLYSDLTGPPVAYEIRGFNFYLYPTPDTNVQITLECWQYPAQIEAMYDDIPWDGMFDHLISDAALKFSIGGHAIAVDATFAAEIENGISQVMSSRSAPLPTRRPHRSF